VQLLGDPLAQARRGYDLDGLSELEREPDQFASGGVHVQLDASVREVHELLRRVPDPGADQAGDARYEPEHHLLGLALLVDPEAAVQLGGQVETLGVGKRGRQPPGTGDPVHGEPSHGPALRITDDQIEGTPVHNQAQRLETIVRPAARGALVLDVQLPLPQQGGQQLIDHVVLGLVAPVRLGQVEDAPTELLRLPRCDGRQPRAQPGLQVGHPAGQVGAAEEAEELSAELEGQGIAESQEGALAPVVVGQTVAPCRAVPEREDRNARLPQGADVSLGGPPVNAGQPTDVPVGEWPVTSQCVEQANAANVLGVAQVALPS